MMNLCIPFNTIESFNTKLSRNGWVGYGKGKPTDATKHKISQNVDRAMIDVVVTLARSRIRTGDLLDLSIGDVITTEQEVTDPLELAVQDVPKFNAKAGAFKGKKAVQIDSFIEKPAGPDEQPVAATVTAEGPTETHSEPDDGKK